MTFVLIRLVRFCDALSEGVGRLVAWLTLGMVAVTFGIVLFRYLFNTGSIAVQESVMYMHALVFLLGSAYTLRHDGHVRVDIFYRGFGDRGRAWVDLLGSALLLLPVSTAILWLSWDYVATSWALLEGSRETGGLPGVFLLKSAIPAMAVLLIVQGIALAGRSALVLMGHPEFRSEPDGTGEV